MAKWTNLKFKTWLKEIEPASLSQEKLKNEAIKFSKEFVEVDKKTIAKVVDDFEIEHKQVVADVLHSVFEEMGGEEGKRRGRRDVPPKNYFPQDENMLKIFQNETNLEKKCVKCNTLLSSRIEVKNHIQMNHEEELKKAFSKEAMSLVPFHNSYLSWLQKDHIVNALASRCCKDRNKVDLKRSNENVDDTYFKMIKNQNTADDLIETQRTIIVSQKDGTEKKKVLKYQLANVTTRPRSPIDEESKESCKRKNNEAERKQAKKVTNILDHISGNDEDVQAALISKVIDQKGQNFADKVTLKSKELQDCKKLSPEETAAFLSSANLSTNVLTRGITLFNKKWGHNPFASQKKVMAVREQILPISRFLF